MTAKAPRVAADLDALHGAVDAAVAAAAAALPPTAVPGCGPGCADCCADGLRVFAIEADAIAAAVAAQATPPVVHADGACPFLGADRRCQVYDARPYVCRSQGAVLRWHEDEAGDDAGDCTPGVVERRATCAVHLQDVDLDALPRAATFELGPFEGRLVAVATLALAQAGGKGLPQRVALRTLARRLVRAGKMVAPPEQ